VTTLEAVLVGLVVVSLVVSFVAVLVAARAQFRIQQLEQDQTATELKQMATELKLAECADLLADTEKLLDMVIDCQDQVENDLYGFGEGESPTLSVTQRLDLIESKLWSEEGDGLVERVEKVQKDLYGDEDTDGLRESFGDLWEQVQFLRSSGTEEAHVADHAALLSRIEQLEEDRDVLETAMDARCDVDDALTDRIEKVEQRLKGAGWTVTDDPADLFKNFPLMSPLHLPSDEPKREERCLAGQCNPSDCEREQCPHRTAEFTVTPFTGVLSEFDGKEWSLTASDTQWDLVEGQGQVELPCCERAEGEARQPNPQQKVLSE